MSHALRNCSCAFKRAKLKDQVKVYMPKLVVPPSILSLHNVVKEVMKKMVPMS